MDQPLKFRFTEHLPVDTLDESGKYLMEYYPPLRDADGPGSTGGGTAPPVLISHGDRYHVVTGTRTVDACRREGRVLPCALVIDLIREPVFYTALIELKAEMGGFNEVEKAISLKMLRDEKLEPGKKDLLLLGIPSNPSLIEQYLRFAAAPPYLLDAVAGGELHVTTAFEIMDFSQEERERIASFTETVRLGTKKRNAMLVMVREIAKRDGKTALEVIADRAVENILLSGMDPPHKGRKIFERVHQIRYPHIEAYGKRFSELLDSVGFDPKVRFHIPENFEKWQFGITFPFRSLEEYMEMVAHLQQAGNGEALGKLLKTRF